MPSDYVKDLVDHKRRVASYLESVANELSSRQKNMTSMTRYFQNCKSMHMARLN